MLDFKFDPKATYLIACTYGPDSMALLDMVQKKGGKPIVCCINYHLFATSNEDAASLADYCKKAGLEMEYLDCDTLPEESKQKEGTDFKLWARKIRYAFFQEQYAKHHASGLFVAHQQDDVIESYLMEKEGMEKSGGYALSPMQEVAGMMVIRPLLHFTHQDLLEYNEENHVPYSSNSEKAESEFIRSEIRKRIARLNEVERAQILDEMIAKKSNLILLRNEIKQRIDDGEELEIRALLALPRDEFVATLASFVARADASIVLSAKDVEELRAFMLSPKPNGAYHLKGDAYLLKEYDIVLLGHNPSLLPYTYTLEKPGKLSTEQFDLDFSMGAEDRGITEADYPLTIRTALPQDSYVAHGYLQNVRKAYSMWKMPTAIREIWPVFINKDGKIIYVPRFAMDFREYHTSVLHLHLPEETK